MRSWTGGEKIKLILKASVHDSVDWINMDQTAVFCEYSNDHSGPTTGRELLSEHLWVRPPWNWVNMQKQSYTHLKEKQWKHWIQLRSEARTLSKELRTAQICSTHTFQRTVYSSDLQHAHFPKHLYLTHNSVISNTITDNKAAINFSLAVKCQVSQKLLQWHSIKLYCDSFISAVSLIATSGNTVVNLHNENNFCSSSLLVSAGGWL